MIKKVEKIQNCKIHKKSKNSEIPYKNLEKYGSIFKFRTSTEKSVILATLCTCLISPSSGISDGTYRYNEVSKSINTDGTVVSILPIHTVSNKYVCTPGNVKKLVRDFKKIFFQSGEIFE